MSGDSNEEVMPVAMRAARRDPRETRAAAVGPTSGDRPVANMRAVARHRKEADYPYLCGAAQPAHGFSGALSARALPVRAT
jgi:hypothetical protein